jgi:putative membrane protein
MTVAEQAKRLNLSEQLQTLGRGFLMGLADVVPGVSGGTVALILGHYQRLITAISHIDANWLRLVAQRRMVEAWSRIDASFLISLAIGMVLGVISFASLIHHLLEDYPEYTLALFFGLIIASSWLVAHQVERFTPARWGLLALGTAVAAGLCLLQPVPTQLGWLNVFLSAMVAICAMILPGISGAFILLLLGMYQPITGLLRSTLGGDITAANLGLLLAFCAGCLCGLLLFSRLLRWLLEHYRHGTMSLLVGLMLGSLYRLWPFRSTMLDADGQLTSSAAQSQPIWPWDSTASTLVVLAIVALAATAVLGLHRIGSRHATS